MTDARESGDAVASVTCAQREHALICEENRASAADLPVLMFSGECRSRCTAPDPPKDTGAEKHAHDLPAGLWQCFWLFLLTLSSRYWPCCSSTATSSSAENNQSGRVRREQQSGVLPRLHCTCYHCKSGERDQRSSALMELTVCSTLCLLKKSKIQQLHV